MDFFAHINELGSDGWGLLRTLVLSGNKLVVWGPSLSHLNSKKLENATLPTPEEFFWYVNNGHIQIRGREWWIKNEQRRKDHKWEHAKWSEDFDAEILRIWREDQSNKTTSVHSARVIINRDEDGDDWAIQKVNEGIIDVDRLKFSLAKCPEGYQQKALRAGEGDYRKIAISLLRDARNHGLAFVDSKADRNIGSPKDQLLYNVLEQSIELNNQSEKNITHRKPDANRLIDIVGQVTDTVKKAGKPAVTQEEAFERTMLLLEDKTALSQYRSWVSDCDSFLMDIPDNEELFFFVKDKLIKEISAGASNAEFLDYLLPKTPLLRITSILGVIFGLIGLKSGSPTAPLSLLMLGVRPFEIYLQNLGLLKEKYHGTKWPLYLAQGTTDSYRNEREAFLRNLHEKKYNE